MLKNNWTLNRHADQEEKITFGETWQPSPSAAKIFPEFTQVSLLAD